MESKTCINEKGIMEVLIYQLAKDGVTEHQPIFTAADKRVNKPAYIYICDQFSMYQNVLNLRFHVPIGLGQRITTKPSLVPLHL